MTFLKVEFDAEQALYRSELSNVKFNLTHWGRATHICVGDLAITGSDNGLSPDQRQAII